MPRIDSIKFIRGTTAQWAASSLVLADGEPGFDTTIKRTKMGDGVSLWGALPFESSNISEATALRMRAPNGTLWDWTVANDGVPITTSVAGEGTGIDSIRFTAPAGQVWSYSVANDGVLIYVAAA